MSTRPRSEFPKSESPNQIPRPKSQIRKRMSVSAETRVIERPNQHGHTDYCFVIRIRTWDLIRKFGLRGFGLRGFGLRNSEFPPPGPHSGCLRFRIFFLCSDSCRPTFFHARVDRRVGVVPRAVGHEAVVVFGVDDDFDPHLFGGVLAVVIDHYFDVLNPIEIFVQLPGLVLGKRFQRARLAACAARRQSRSWRTLLPVRSTPGPNHAGPTKVYSAGGTGY